MSLNEILATLRNVYSKYSGIRLGIAGSYANGTQQADSDIDVVIDGDSMRVDIMEYIKSQFQTEVDVLWVELMQAVIGYLLHKTLSYPHHLLHHCLVYRMFVGR